MKIHDKILLFAIEFFINFLESNASWDPRYGYNIPPNHDPESARQHGAIEYNFMFDPNGGPALPEYVERTPRLPPNFRPSGSGRSNALPQHHGTNASMPIYISERPHSHRSGIEGGSQGGTSSRGSRRGRGAPPTICIYYLNRKIFVPLIRRISGEYEAKSCTFNGKSDHGTIPDVGFRNEHVYYVQAIYGQFTEFRIKCVVFVALTHVGGLDVIGVKTPPKPSSSFGPDNPRGFNPDESTWFIGAVGMYFRVTMIPERPFYTITLKDDANKIPNYDQIALKHVQSTRIDIAGISFVAFQEGSHPYGVMRTPEWWSRIEAAWAEYPQD